MAASGRSTPVQRAGNQALSLMCLVLVLAWIPPTLQAGQEPARGTRALTPEGVARAMEDRDTGRDSRGEMRMRLVDRQGRVRERSLAIAALQGTGGKGDKTLVRFTYPNDINGTAFLVWEHPTADDERFLYLPALGRVRRIAGQEKQESFVGSDLSYEDIGGRDIDDYTYAFASENASVDGADGSQASRLGARVAGEGQATPSSRARCRSSSRTTSSSVHADIFNRRNEREKLFDVRRLERVDGIWTALDLVVANERDRTRTELVDDRRCATTSASPTTTSPAARWSRARDERGGWREAVFRFRLPLCAVIVIGFVVFAPSTNFTDIDNDLTHVDLEDRSRLPAPTSASARSSAASAT